MSLGDGKGVTGFIDPTATRIKYDKEMQAGDTTDDWQLTEAVAESIIVSGGHFDLRNCALKHLEAFRLSTFGWGGTTKKALIEIRDGKRSYNTRAPSYGPNTGLGNGIMMKVAPLAVAHYRHLSHEGGRAKLRADVMALSRMTHADDRAGIAALVIAEVILYGYEHSIKSVPDRVSLLEHVLQRVIEAESDSEAPTGWQDGYTDKVSDVIKKVSSVWQFIKFDLLRPQFNALSTLETCLLIFLRYPREFEKGVCEAVNCGGDTDTQAAIVGSMIGAHVSEMGIPKEWLTFRNKFDHARSVADRLIAVCA
jgi:ADP-ribosylglycohydrolase